ncbi:MAG: sulfite exporter TauE/SafE family protein [Deltaproteobacteria bacterium]|nr:sulfite exporter TauE/SafE family protein [Deltaproteobacteria bacterium]
MIVAVLALAAFATSIVSGILGMAGGVALLGVMTAVMAPAVVVPVHGVVQLVSNGARTAMLLEHAAWREVAIFLGPLVLGVAIATRIGRLFDYRWLEPTIGVVLLAFIAWRRAQPKVRRPPTWLYAIVGFAVGLVMLFIGATGPLSAIVFKRDDWAPQRVVATMAVAQTGGHLLKLPAFFALGFDYAPHFGLLVGLSGAAIAGTWVGQRLLARVPPKTFGLYFDAALFVLGVWLIVAGGVALPRP